MSEVSSKKLSKNSSSKNGGSRQSVSTRALEARRNVEDKLEELRLKRVAKEFDFDFA